MTVPTPRLTGRYGAPRLSRTARLDRLALLGAAVGDSPEEAAALAVRASGARTGAALVAAFAVLAADRPAAQGRLLLVLVDLDGRSLEDAAQLLDMPSDQARARLELARPGGRVAPSCRGWGLASGLRGLTPAESDAGAAHLLLCRHCRDHRAAVEAARRQLAARATGTTGLLAAAQVVLAGGTGGALVGGTLLGKAAIGAVAGFGAAVLATGAVVAAVPPAGFGPDRTPAVAPVVRPDGRGAASPSGSPSAAPRPSATSSPGPCSLPCLPADRTPVVGGVDAVLPGDLEVPLPLPTSLPELPGLPLPTLLPTALPLPLPSLPPLLP